MTKRHIALFAEKRKRAANAAARAKKIESGSLCTNARSAPSCSASRQATKAAQAAEEKLNTKPVPAKLTRVQEHPSTTSADADDSPVKV